MLSIQWQLQLKEKLSRVLVLACLALVYAATGIPYDHCTNQYSTTVVLGSGKMGQELGYIMAYVKNH